ncbi:hypothetical protein [Capnocytophaga granulosa]|uniref:hypothetical protein n=1 Tax=Capnocytophaga granulosa TaxID=45242 RepID=UPI003619A110
MKAFLIFILFPISTMAQITITGKVTDHKGKPLANISVSTDVITYTKEGHYAANSVKTDANGMYKIQAKQWDTLYFYGVMDCYIVFKDTPHQVYNHTMDRIYRNSDIHIEYAYGCGILFIRNDKIVKEEDREAFKEELRNGQFYKYSVMEDQELSKHYGFRSQYGLVAYTKDYYNEEYKE